eukprot:23932-Hanusia_phi.AAC.1
MLQPGIDMVPGDIAAPGYIFGGVAPCGIPFYVCQVRRMRMMVLLITDLLLSGDQPIGVGVAVTIPSCCRCYGR